MPLRKILRQIKRNMGTAKHSRHCKYWAGCDPISAEEGNCDCGLRETKKKPEVYVDYDEEFMVFALEDVL